MTVSFLEDGYLCDWQDVPIGAGGLERIKRDGRRVRLSLTPVNPTDRFYARKDFGDEGITHRAMIRGDKGLKVEAMKLLYVMGRGFRPDAWFKVVSVQASVCSRYITLLLSEIEVLDEPERPDVSEKYGY